MFMTMLVIGNDIDLSVGSNFATVGMIVALLFQNGTNIWLASLIGLIVGGLLGLANGLITVKAALPPFIVTLGTQMIYRGLALVISGGAPASVRLPAAFYNITGPDILEPASPGPVVYWNHNTGCVPPSQDQLWV